MKVIGEPVATHTPKLHLRPQQTFELRCDYGSRRLDKTELAVLIELMLSKITMLNMSAQLCTHTNNCGVT